MGKVIVYINDEGKQICISPNYSCGLTVEQIAEKDVPYGKSYNIMELEDVPVVINSTNEELFITELAIGREAQVFSGADLIRLMPYSYTLNELIRYKNFGGGVANGVPYAGLKQVLAGLVAGGMILQSDSDKLAGILLEQNIDLGSY